MRSPGIEPGSITWQATIITTRPRTRDLNTTAAQSKQVLLGSLTLQIEKKKKTSLINRGKIKEGVPCGARTRDLWLIRPTLYQLS